MTLLANDRRGPFSSAAARGGKRSFAAICGKVCFAHQLATSSHSVPVRGFGYVEPALAAEVLA